MSRIYEALRTAEATRSAHGAPAGNRGVMEMTDQRRFRRWELDVPLTVYGRGSSGSPFYQEAQAVNVSAEGALIQIRAPVCEGQELLLINNYSSKEQRCCIVRVRSNGTEMNEVGVKFPSPNPEFWNIPDPSCDLPEKPEDEGF
jgi:PilZ domain